MTNYTFYGSLWKTNVLDFNFWKASVGFLYSLIQIGSKSRWEKICCL